MARKTHSPLGGPTDTQAREYQAEDDHRTITRAGEIHGDKQRMAGVRAHHQKQTKALHKVGVMLGHTGSLGKRY